MAFTLHDTMDENGVQYIAVKDVLCKVTRTERKGAMITTVICDRPLGHYPSLNHLDSQERVSFYREDKRQ